MNDQISEAADTAPLNEETHSEPPVAGGNLNEFFETEPAVKIDGSWVGEMARGAVDAVKDLFIAKHEQAFKNFAEEKVAIERCRTTFQDLCRNVEAEKTIFEQTKSIVSFYKGGKFSESIFKAASAHPAGIRSLETVAMQFAGSYILSIFGDKILDESAKNLAEAEKKLADFKRENSGSLKRMGLS